MPAAARFEGLSEAAVRRIVLSGKSDDEETI
jgi:hypothetical protein